MDESLSFKGQRLIFKYVILLWALVAVFGWIFSFSELFINWPLYFKGAATKLMMILRCSVIALGLFVFCWILSWKKKKGKWFLKWDRPDWLLLRAGLYTFLPALLISTILKLTSIDSLPEHGFVIRSAFYSFLWGGWLIWILAAFRRLSCGNEQTKDSRLIKAMDLICMNCVVFLVLGELFSVSLNKTNLSVMMNIENVDVATRVNRLRQKAGKPYFNFYLNSGGYNDEEFFIADDSDLVIGFIGDSFGFGIVPYDFNFVTVAERRLQNYFKDSFQRIAIHNVSMPAIAMEEYVWLLQTEVLPLKPSFVVLCLFIGNDIYESAAYVTTSLQRYCFQNWYMCRYIRRAILYIKEYDSLKQNAVTMSEPDPNARKISGALPESVVDTSKEKPYFLRDTFIRIERMRFEVCDSNNFYIERGFEGVFSGLRFFQDTLSDNLLVILMPDEFQVNDDLYAELLTINPNFSSYKRDYPQQRLIEFCKERGIRYLDLLPILREGQKLDRTYHLQDTHLNAHGNKLVGIALGEELIHIITEKKELGGI